METIPRRKERYREEGRGRVRRTEKTIKKIIPVQHIIWVSVSGFILSFLLILFEKMAGRKLLPYNITGCPVDDHLLAALNPVSTRGGPMK